MQETNLQVTVKAYLQAFDQKDLSQCLDFFAEDATIDFASGIYQGKQAIEKWHKERFAANLRVVRVDGIRVQGDTVIVEAVVTSNRLKAWRIGRLTGTVTVVFQQSKIRKAKFGLRTTIPIEAW